MIVRNELRKTNAYKVALCKYRKATKKRYGGEILGWGGLFIIVTVLVLNGTFTLSKLFIDMLSETPIEFFISFIMVVCAVPTLFYFFMGMLGQLSVYEIHIDDIVSFSKASNISGENGKGKTGFVIDTSIYENGIRYHFVEPCYFPIEIGKTYFIAGRGTNLFFVIKEKN